MQLLQPLGLQIAAVEREFLQVGHVLQGSDEHRSIGQAEIIMGELDLLNADVCSQAFAKHAESFVSHLVVAHIEELEISSAK